ncbi:MAG: type II and III secretion system protein family protein [Hyphomicrobiales bacterium]
MYARFIRVLALAAMTGLGALLVAPGEVDAGGRNNLRISESGAGAAREVNLGLNKSIVVELPRDAKDVLVSNPAIADVVIRTPRRAFIIGVAVGEANVVFFDGAGGQIATLDLQVSRDLVVIESTIREMMPGSNISVEMIGEAVALRGTAQTPADAQRAVDIATRIIGKPELVVNMISVTGQEQVMLKVTVAEVQRKIIKQLGIDLEAVLSGGGLSSAIVTQNPFSVAGKAISGSGVANTWTRANGDYLTGTLRALEQNGLVKVLAEPNLSAISGETANFLAGGEYPVPTGRDTDGNILVEYKPFGIALGFTPVVLSEGRISLHVTTEVSELTDENAIALTSATASSSLSIPGLKVRRASTTVEVPSGGALAIAGLIQEDMKQTIDGIPGLKKLPVLGALFRSRDFSHQQTELAIIVTPYMVKPVAPDKLEGPGRNLDMADDPQTILLQRINRIYGVGSAPANGAYHGRYGFIVE